MTTREEVLAFPDSPTGRIYEAVKRIPRGKVATYGQVAKMAGNERMSRAVGNDLHKNVFLGTVLKNTFFRMKELPWMVPGKCSTSMELFSREQENQ